MTQRDLTPEARADLLLGTSRHAVIGYVRIRASAIVGGLAYVGDTVPHLIDGVEYVPVGVLIPAPEETEVTSPSLDMALPDVDGVLGEALRGTDDSVSVSIDWRLMDGFDLSVVPRVPDGSTPAPLWSIRDWAVVEVTGADGARVGLTIAPADIEQEPYPLLRATPEIAPGLHP